MKVEPHVPSRVPRRDERRQSGEGACGGRRGGLRGPSRGSSGGLGGGAGGGGEGGGEGRELCGVGGRVSRALLAPEAAGGPQRGAGCMHTTHMLGYLWCDDI